MLAALKLLGEIQANRKRLDACPRHDFRTVPMQRKYRCTSCGGEIDVSNYYWYYQGMAHARNRAKTDRFIEKAKRAHGDKYDYSKTVYVNSITKVAIICPTHGDFTQTPNGHTNKTRPRGCPGCGLVGSQNSVAKLTTQEFVTRAITIHGQQYDYSKTVYTQYRLPVTIECQKHGEFRQTPHKHLSGRGCPFCNESHGERAIANWLTEKGLEFTRQAKFDSCRHLLPLPFDFSVSYGDKTVLIEYQGEHHFRPTRWGGAMPEIQAKINLGVYQLRDRIKADWCAARPDIELLVITYRDLPNIADILTTGLSHGRNPNQAPGPPEEGNPQRQEAEIRGNPQTGDQGPPHGDPIDATLLPVPG